MNLAEIIHFNLQVKSILKSNINLDLNAEWQIFLGILGLGIMRDFFLQLIMLPTVHKLSHSIF